MPSRGERSWSSNTFPPHLLFFLNNQSGQALRVLNTYRLCLEEVINTRVPNLEYDLLIAIENGLELPMMFHFLTTLIIPSRDMILLCSAWLIILENCWTQTSRLQSLSRTSIMFNLLKQRQMIILSVWDKKMSMSTRFR